MKKFYIRFSLVELLLVTAILAILMSFLIPSLRQAHEASRKFVCINNEKQTYLGSMFYADDYMDYFPAEYSDEAYLWTNGGIFKQKGSGGSYNRSSWDDQLSFYVGRRRTKEQLAPLHVAADNFPEFQSENSYLKCPSGTVINKYKPTRYPRSYSLHGSANQSQPSLSPALSPDLDPWRYTNVRGVSSQWLSRLTSPGSILGYSAQWGNISAPSMSVAFAENHFWLNTVGNPAVDINLYKYARYLSFNSIYVSNGTQTVEDSFPHGMGMVTTLFADGHVEHLFLPDTVNGNADPLFWSGKNSDYIEKGNGIWDCFRSDDPL